MSGNLDVVARFLATHCGFEIGPDKHYQLQSRLAPILEAAKLTDFAELGYRLEADRNGALAHQVIDAVANNETYFFRDRTAYAQLREIALPRLIEARREIKSLRIWCAACSTGQEPYSIAMLLDEFARQLTGWRIEILATDISRRALEIAQNGAYSQFEVQRGLPIAHLMRYFRQEGESWRLNEYVRSAVTFRPFNLLDDFGGLGVFDIVICRNVLIYFDVRRKANILDRFASQLAMDGYLMLGVAESPVGLSNAFATNPEHMALCQRQSARPRLAAAV